MAGIELRSVSKTFVMTGTRALAGVDLSLRPGQIHALVGENGAGKSTLARILCGFETADSGQLLVDGRPLTFGSHRDAERAGIGFVPQYGMLAEGLTVAENLALGHEPRRCGFLYDRRRGRAQAAQLCQQYGFSLHVDAPVASLAAAKKREAEILRAVARASRLLVLDEPTAVLSEAESHHLFDLLRQLQDRGLAILYISHRVKEILALADNLTVLRDGRVHGTRPMAGLDECSLAELIVDSSACLTLPTANATTGPSAVVLELTDLVVRGRGADSLDGLNLTVRSGEVVGVTALGSNGLETLEAVVSGRLAPDSGSVRLAGRLLASWPPERLRSGLLAYIPSRREELGLCLAATVSDNILSKAVHGISAAAYAWGAEPVRLAGRLLQAGSIRARLHSPVASLSGGNRQRLVTTRELDLDTPCLLAANPAQGLDSAAREQLLLRIQARRDAGAAVLLLSADLEDLAAIADRAFVLYRGQMRPVDPAQLADGTGTLARLLTGGA